MFSGAGGTVTTNNRGLFNPTARLDPSQVQDRRGTTQSSGERLGIAIRGGVTMVRTNLGTMIGGRVRLVEAQAALREFRKSSRGRGKRSVGRLGR